MIDKLKLCEYDLNLLEEILKKHPEWLEYTENHPDSASTFNILIPCPTNGNPPICIDRLGDGPNLFFGPGFYDYYQLRSMLKITWLDKLQGGEETLLVEAIDKVIEDIKSEKNISVYLKGFIGGCALHNLEKYEILIAAGKISYSVSWLGNYNYNYKSRTL